MKINKFSIIKNKNSHKYNLIFMNKENLIKNIFKIYKNHNLI